MISRSLRVQLQALLAVMICSVLICLNGLAAEMQLEVSVEGIKDDLLENVHQHLRIYRQRQSISGNSSRLDRLHRLATKDIKAALKPLGYYNSTVQSSLEKHGDTIRAHYSISPGSPVLVEDVEVSAEGEGYNNPVLQKAIESFPLQSGDVLNQGLYQDSRKQLLNSAFGEGFLDAAFAVRQIKIDRDRNRASIRLLINTGDQYYFGETTSEQQVIRPLLLQNYLPYKEGSPYKPSGLVLLQSELYKTGFFSRVAVSGNVGEKSGNHIPVTIELEPVEKKNQYSLGAGYATDTGLKARVDWSNRLLNDRGHSIRSAFLLGELETNASLTYLVPLENARTNTLASNLSYQKKRWQDTDSELFSVGLTRSYGGRLLNVDTTLAYRNERYSVGTVSDTSSLLLPGINFGYVLADSLKEMKNGQKASLGFLGSKKELFSDTDFLQMTVDGKFVLTPLTGWRLIGRGVLGLTFVDSISSIPPSLRFYAGGDNTIRGYEYKSIGPTDDDGNVVGGTYLVVGSVEVEKLLTDQWSMAVFLDTGNATDDLSGSMKQGAGGGIRYRLPFGQVRVDLASAIREDGHPWRLHLTVGGDL